MGRESIMREKRLIMGEIDNKEEEIDKRERD
jgi:hypothetical protein